MLSITKLLVSPSQFALRLFQAMSGTPRRLSSVIPLFWGLVQQHWKHRKIMDSQRWAFHSSFGLNIVHTQMFNLSWMFLSFKLSHDSWIIIVTGCGLDVHTLISGRYKDFFLHHNIQTGSAAQPPFEPKGSGGYLPWVKRPEDESNHLLHIVREAVPPFRHIS